MVSGHFPHSLVLSHVRRVVGERHWPFIVALLEGKTIKWAGEQTGVGASRASQLRPAPNGRDHNHRGFSCWLADGGVKGGTVVGACDEFGFAAIENPVHVRDLHATMLHLLGFDHERLAYRYAGRDFRLTDVKGRVVAEILAWCAITPPPIAVPSGSGARLTQWLF